MGIHIIADMKDCVPEVLDCETTIVETLRRASDACGATLLGTQSHKFSPQGVTAIAMLAESHISLHTWPETGQCALDIYTCGEMDTKEALFVLVDVLGGKMIEQKVLKRKL